MMFVRICKATQQHLCKYLVIESTFVQIILLQERNAVVPHEHDVGTLDYSIGNSIALSGTNLSCHDLCVFLRGCLVCNVHSST